MHSIHIAMWPPHPQGAAAFTPQRSTLHTPKAVWSKPIVGSLVCTMIGAFTPAWIPRAFLNCPCSLYRGPRAPRPPLPSPTPTKIVAPTISMFPCSASISYHRHHFYNLSHDKFVGHGLHMTPRSARCANAMSCKLQPFAGAPCPSCCEQARAERQARHLACDGNACVAALLRGTERKLSGCQ